MKRLLFTSALITVPGVFLAALAGLMPLPAAAQIVGVAQITGTVVDAQHRPITDAQVRLSGVAAKETTTASDGSFAFVGVPAGTYRLDITKAGFNAATQDDVVPAAGSTMNLSFTLQAASLTSLTVIGSVSVNASNGANAINTTPASIVDVPASTFADQGQLSVNQVLNEEPGVTIGLQSCSFNGASPLAAGIPSVRGGLPYETESLIDGHAISLGQSGLFSPTFLSPYMLQNVEIVKGPGATSPSINYAINGTINYRTLEPTVKARESFDIQGDQFGGTVANFRATGTLPGSRLSYAFDYETQGTQGFDRGFTPFTEFFPNGPAYLNGTPVNLFGGFTFLANTNPNVLCSFIQQEQFMMCCPNLTQTFNERNELGKLRYAFTPSTTLTVTWLGGQAGGSRQGGYLTPCAEIDFSPPAGYTGSLAGGMIANSSGQSIFNNDDNIQDTNLFESEFHTPIGKSATLLLRQYSSSIQTFGGGPGHSGATAGGLTTITGAMYGGLTIGGTPELFNGQIGTVTISQYFEGRSYNDLNGFTGEIDKQAGNDLLSLSYDEEKTSTLATSASGSSTLIDVPGGSSQTFRSIMGRAQFELGQRLDGTLSDNFGSYTDVYTQNDGLTFQSATQSYEAPRLSLTWRPNANQSIRGSAGVSIAPPYIGLLNNNLAIGSGTEIPALYYVETGNSGDVLPETAFGYDLGFDTRLHSPYTVLSADIYQTILHNQFLQATSVQGTYTCTKPASGNYGITAPLFVTRTQNLGHSEYEGIEISLHRTPPTGWGYRIQGSFMRAFAYDLPASFYDTAAAHDSANLGILPNINFQSDGYGYNGISAARIPYSMGYGEINHRSHNGAYFLAGITYYGPNNSYNEPAFEVVTASYDQPLTRNTSLQLSVYNVTDAYSSIFQDSYFQGKGILTPLITGQEGMTSLNVVGPSIARLTLHVDL